MAIENYVGFSFYNPPTILFCGLEKKLLCLRAEINPDNYKA
jgi:hypothetical protein